MDASRRLVLARADSYPTGAPSVHRENRTVRQSMCLRPPGSGVPDNHRVLDGDSDAAAGGDDAPVTRLGATP